MRREQLVKTWSRYALPLGVGGVVVCAVITVSTFLADAPAVPSALTAVLFVGVFPLHAGTVVVLRRLGDGARNPMSELLRLPPGVLAIGATAFVLFWLAGMSGLLGTSGATESRGGRYYASDHGELTEISKREYDERSAGESRIFSAVPGGFYVAGALVGYLARKVDAPADPPSPAT